MTQHPAQDPSLTFLSQIKCGSEKNGFLSPIEEEQGGTETCSCCCRLVPLVSVLCLRVAGIFASVTFALSSSWQELCVAAWEKTVSPAAIGMLRCQMHLGTGHPWTAKSKMGSCRVMQMHCMVQVYQLCQSVLSTTASWNVCLHRGWHSGSKSWSPFFMREESR